MIRLLVTILSVKVFGTLFAVYIFADFTQLGDSELYLSSTLGLSEAFVDRTTFLMWLGGSLNRLVGSLASHFLFSISVGLAIFYLVKDFYYSMSFTTRLLFWLVILSPSFVVWSSIVGKEALAIATFSVVLALVLRVTQGHKLNISMLILFLCMSLFLRPHYALGLIWFSIVCVFISKDRMRMSLSANKSFLLLVTFGASLFSVILLFFHGYYESVLKFVMATSEGYFLHSTDAGTNRYSIDWETLSDFYENMVWGIPFSIIGPLPSEVLARPILFPFFLEGVFCFGLIIWIVFYSFFGFRHSTIKKIAVLGMVPAILISLLVHYPFGIFNTGSALRYKQALVPILYFIFFALAAIENKLTVMKRNAEEC